MDRTNTNARETAAPRITGRDRPQAGSAVHSDEDRNSGSAPRDAVRVKTKIDTSAVSPLDEGLDGTFPASDPVSATRR